MMKQSDAVYQAMVSVVGEFEGACVPTKEQRATAATILFEGFRAGRISISTQYDDDGLKKYIPGLISNWLRKDSRLNGGVKYEAKNPGSRTGSTDPQVKAMRLLLSTKVNASERAEIQGFIDKRLAEIKPNTAKQLTDEQVAVLKAAGLEHLVK